MTAQADATAEIPQVSPQGDEEYLDWLTDVAGLRAEAKRFREAYGQTCERLAETFAAAMGDPEPQKYLTPGSTIASVVQEERENWQSIFQAQHSLIAHGRDLREDLAASNARWQAAYVEQAARAAAGQSSFDEYQKLLRFLLDRFPNARVAGAEEESAVDTAIRILSVGQGLIQTMLPIVRDHVVNPIFSVLKREGVA